MDSVVVGRGQNDVLLHDHKPAGSWEPIENINDPYVQEMGRFAVMEHTHKLCGVGMAFIRVVSGESMMVREGKKYRLVVEVEETMIIPSMPVSIEFYMAVVLDKQCDKSWKLVSFDPFHVPPFGPGPVINNNA